nr:putative NTPase (NACHT family) [Virgibacillus halodenitrificans]
MALETYSYAYFLDVGKRLTAPLIDKVVERVSGKYSSVLREGKVLKASKYFLATSYQKCSCVNTIVYPGEFKKIEDIYVPLTIQALESDVSYKVDEDIDVFHHSNKVFIKDSAGMGKTTLSKRIFLNLVKQKKHTPIFVEVRNLKDESIKKQILEMMGIGDEVEDDFIKSMRFAFIFDGLDEIPYDKKQSIAARILSFCESFSEEKIVITSRDEDVVNLFYSFSNFQVAPLEKEESLEVIRKIAKDTEISERLIEEITKKRDDTIDSFLTTPLYVCLLFSVYRHRSKIPDQKHIFYANVYDALFNHHDATSKGGFFREKHSKLDASNFEAVVRRLAFYCLRKGQVEFSTHELREKVHEIIEKLEFISCSSQDYVKDLTETVPLFQKEGQMVRWSHKSLMEYFAAAFVFKDTKGKNKDVLMSLYSKSSSGELYNFFDIYASEDTEGFKQTVVEKVLSDFVEYHRAAFTEGKYSKISPAAIDLRKSVSFGCELEFFVAGEKDNKKLIDFITRTFGESDIDGNFRSLRIVSLVSGDEDFIEKRLTVAINVDGGPAINLLPVVNKVCSNVFVNGSVAGDPVQDKESFIKNFKPGKRYKIDQNPRSFCNLEKNFSAVNSLLQISAPYVLDYSESCKELEKIRQSRDSLDQWLESLV